MPAKSIALYVAIALLLLMTLVLILPSDFWHHYTEILLDPAHLAVEVTIMLVVDVFFLGMVWPLLRSMAKTQAHKVALAEHLVIDREHGVSHHHATATASSQPATEPTREETR